MKLPRAMKWFLGVALMASEALAADGQGASKPKEDLGAIAEEAYVYGYPLMVLDQTKRQITNVPKATNLAAPPNQLARVEKLPAANFKAVVRPNVDTLYTSAFLDLSKEPVVLHVPDTQGRYYLMPMLDAYTNVFSSPGKRTTGTEEHEFAVVGPDWKGSLPKGVTQVKAPTNMVWLIGRIEIKGKDELPAVSVLANQVTLTPLSAYGHPYAPPLNQNIDTTVPMHEKPPVTVAKMSDKDYFKRLATLMKENPPPSRDREVLARFAQLGLQPGSFEPSPEGAQAIEGVSKRAMPRIQSHMGQLGSEVNGWRLATNLGDYGTRYLDRATVALEGLGANLAQDAIYPALTSDTRGQPLKGTSEYVLHFEKGQTPPVNAFWSLTMYDAQGYFIANPINRYAIGDRDPLQRNPDGSLDLYVQNMPPAGVRKSNWLPAPKGVFNVLLRIYWPQESVIHGTWKPPGLRPSSTQVGKAAFSPHG